MEWQVTLTSLDVSVKGLILKCAENTLTQRQARPGKQDQVREEKGSESFVLCCLVELFD